LSVILIKPHGGDRACGNTSEKEAAVTEKIYWFVAAVFREIDDLAATLAKLRAHNVLAESLLILAAHLGDISEKLSRSGSGDVVIVTVDRSSDDRRWISSNDALLRDALRELLDAAQPEAVANGHGAASTGADGKGHAGIYAQLRHDADDGANILVASVANPAEQLSVARILLRQKCERVLTHEIAARPS
jgi:hypothetical protein